MIYYKEIAFASYRILLQSNRTELLRVKFIDNSEIIKYEGGAVPDVLCAAYEQIKEYFEGRRFKFNLPIKLEGSVFFKKVWSEIISIPYGELISYSEIAKKLGNINKSRAVGLAASKNIIPIIIPCHRVVGRNGKLIGFAGGLLLKRKLIELEAEYSKQNLFSTEE